MTNITGKEACLKCSGGRVVRAVGGSETDPFSGQG